MTKPKTPDPVDPKLAFIEVFKRTGGIAGMTAWAKTHRTLFYSLFGKMINQPAVQVDVNNNVRVDAEATRAALAAAFHRIIDARGKDTGAVYVDGERVYEDGRATVVIEHAPQPDLAQPPSPAASHDAPDAGHTDAAQPSPVHAPTELGNVVPLRSRSSSVPGLDAGVALDADGGLSTTERFILWNGHGRRPP